MCEWIAAGTIWAFVACHLNLSWTYTGLAGWGFQIERCQGQGCSNFQPVGMRDRTPGVTGYGFKDDQILTQSTTYCYRVKAGYGAGVPSDWTWGPYSQVSCGTTLTIGGGQLPRKPLNVRLGL